MGQGPERQEQESEQAGLGKRPSEEVITTSMSAILNQATDRIVA